MKAWRHLGLVETIYEEEHEHEHEDSSTSPPSPSPPSIYSPPTPLHDRVEAWSLATGCETEVLIHVGGLCFPLHKDPLASRSGYLKRELTGVADLTLSPPLNITAETFTLVIDFCYGNNPVVTPFNVGALRTAASLLEMADTNGGGDENLQQLAETYFCHAVAVNREYASIIFRSCLELLPEAEEAALLVSRCIEALSSMGSGDDFLRSVDEIKSVPIEDFQIVADSMNSRLIRSHDILYKIIDLYLKHNEKVSEEQKNRICNAINCNKLSPELLMHAVQNHRMPLRFIIRAMLVERFNTRSIFSATAQQQPPPLPHHRDHAVIGNVPITLGGILHRDSALRQVAQIKGIMEATATRIKSLEEDLTAMKKILEQSAKQVNALDSVRSASFHLSSTNKIERGERGSISSGSFRFRLKGGTTSVDGALSSPSEGSFSDQSPTPRTKKNLGARLMEGLKSAFRVSTNTSASKGNKITASGRVEGDGKRDDDQETGNEQVIVMKESPTHRRSRSFSSM